MAEIELMEPPTVWRCFHCDEVLETREAAAEHFGDGNYEGEMPLCIEAATSEMRALVLTNREMFIEVQNLRDREEALEFQLGNFEYVTRKLTGKPSGTTSDLEMEWDFMQGRVLAAESAIDAAPRWLATWLRRRAERKWHLHARAHQDTPNA